MKNHNLLGLVATSAILVFVGTANAHEVSQNSDCRQNRQHSGAVGGVVGAGLGAAAGNAIAASSVTPEGIAVGMLVGAIVGHKVGRNSANCETEVSTQNHGRSYGEQRYHSNGRHHRSNHVRREERVVAHDDHQDHEGHEHHQLQQRHQDHNAHMQHQNHVEHAQQSSSQSYNGWYEPSRYSYYGQQNAGAASYQQSGYSSGGQVVQQWSYGPTYVPAPQITPQMMVPNYAPEQYQPTPAQTTPCGRWVCE